MKPSMYSKLSSHIYIQVIKINLKLSQANDMLFKLESSHIYIQVIKIKLKLSHANDMLFKLESHIYIQFKTHEQFG
jgi:hypothetical protein